jgi:hypothetical protein
MEDTARHGSERMAEMGLRKEEKNGRGETGTFILL